MNKQRWYSDGLSAGRCAKRDGLAIGSHPAIQRGREDYNFILIMNRQQKNLDTYREFLRGWRDGITKGE